MERGRLDVRDVDRPAAVQGQEQARGAKGDLLGEAQDPNLPTGRGECVDQDAAGQAAGRTHGQRTQRHGERQEPQVFQRGELVQG